MALSEETPVNLPIGNPISGYQADEDSEESIELNELENQAHAQRVLLSSDAMRYFIAKISSKNERVTVLGSLITKARVSFPSEEGWVVINLSRMEELLEEVRSEKNEQESDVAAEASLSYSKNTMTAGSLGETIVMGNVVSAFEIINGRPIIELAAASADLDALYRFKKGEDVQISEILKNESATLSLEQLELAIKSLTSALDGTYTDEVSAVKMAIMKAVKALS